MPKNKINDSSIFKIDKNGTLIKVKKSSRKLQHFKIPEGVKYIDLFAFEKVHKAQSFTLPSTLQDVNGLPFYRYSWNLKNIINYSPVLFGWWVNNYKYDGKTLIEMKTINLDKYTNSDGKPFTKIDSYSFSEQPHLYPNLNLQKFNTGSFITEIKGFAFDDCRNLEHVEIGKNVQSIDFEAFHKCSKLKSENVISRSPVLFNWWVENHKYGNKTLSEMKTINLDKYTNSDGKPFTKIDSYSFFKPLTSFNFNLQKFNTGSFITKIEQRVFAGCKNLKHVEIGKNVQSIGIEIFNDYPKLKPENVINHSPVLFDWWVKNHKYDGKTLNEMKTIDLDKYTNSDGKPFTIVSETAFFKCFNVQNILFGNTIKQIDRQSFWKCDKLKNIQITNKDIFLDPKAFSNIPKSVNFYVCDKQIKEKLQKVGVNIKQIFVKPIPMEELEESKENKIELTC